MDGYIDAATYAYDDAGRMNRTTRPTGGYNETTFDAMGRAVRSMVVSKAASPTSFTVWQENVSVFDGYGNLVEQVLYRRDDAGTSETNELCADADLADPQPNSDTQTSYVVTWYDQANRPKTVVNYGVLEPDDPADGAAPARSDTVIRTDYEYNSAGLLYKTTDNRDLDTVRLYDDMGRTEYVVENFDDFDGNQSSIGEGAYTDDDRATKYAYTPLSQVRTITAMMPAGVANQTTGYVYSQELTDKGCGGTAAAEKLHRNDLLRAIIYPESENVVTSQELTDTGGYERVEFTYHGNGAMLTREDQRGCILTYTYDEANRLELEAATTLNGVDGTVAAIKRVYDEAGRLINVTSYDDDEAAGNVVNDIQYTFNDWGMLEGSFQAHAGLANTDDEGGTDSPSVKYAYYDDAYSDPWGGTYEAAQRDLRLREVTYPNARVTSYGCGRNNSDDDGLSRFSTILDDTAGIALYWHVGLRDVSRVIFPILRQSYGTFSNNYSGWDRFGRVIEQKWAYGASARDHFTYGDDGTTIYGYDRSGNRRFKKNELAATHSELYRTQNANGYDEHYDGLNRLLRFQRGTLTFVGSVPKEAELSGAPTHEQAWGMDDDSQGGDGAFSLDLLGNWDTFRERDDSGAWDLEQTRTHDDENQIENITPDPPGWIDPVYDIAGNATTIPQPGAETASFTCTYDPWDRLLKVAAGETVVAEYRYDGLNRRVRKFIPNGDDWDVTEYYYNTSWQVLQEDKEEELTREAGTPLGEPAVAAYIYCQYAWSLNYIDAPVLRDRDADGDPGTGVWGKANSGLDERLFYCNDANMNVTALVDTDGKVVERYEYTPYGELTVLDGDPAVDLDGSTEWDPDTDNTSDWANEILYAGYRHDPETNLYHVRNRYLHPTQGTWITRDPIGQIVRQRQQEGPPGLGAAPVIEDAIDSALAEMASKSWLARRIELLREEQAMAVAALILVDGYDPGFVLGGRINLAEDGLIALLDQQQESSLADADYPDGMGLYEYVRGGPGKLTDPSGLLISCSCSNTRITSFDAICPEAVSGDGTDKGCCSSYTCAGKTGNGYGAGTCRPGGVL